MVKTKPNLSDSVRTNLAHYLQHHYKKGTLKHGYKSKAATKFGINRKSVYTIWKNAKEMLDMGLPIYLTNKKRGTIRPKRVIFNGEFFKTVPLKRRTTVRRAALALGVSPYQVWHWKKTKQIKTHTNALKSYLTAANKLRRLQFCVQSLQVDTIHNNITFKSMHQILHIDEKWFYLTQENERYYLTLDEGDPYRAVHNKNYILKIMFLSVVGRPLYAEDGTCIFDGKIGMYPFIEMVAAQRNSVNRDAGTLEMKAVKKITREVNKQLLINKVIPDIKAKWPLGEDGTIFMLQDNARPHVRDDDPDFRAAATSDGFDIHLIYQPANSPDCNVNDLGWFRALQSLQAETTALTVEDLVAAVMTAFENLEDMKLNCVYLTLQSCMVQIMKQRGHNNYKIPHMKKATMIREGTLPVDLEVDKQLVIDCIEYLREAEMGMNLDPLYESIQAMPNELEV